MGPMPPTLLVWGCDLTDSGNAFHFTAVGRDWTNEVFPKKLLLVLLLHPLEI